MPPIPEPDGRATKHNAPNAANAANSPGTPDSPTTPDMRNQPSTSQPSPADPAAEIERARRRALRRSMAIRMLLLALSMGGAVATIGVWASGDTGLAMRILAGCIILIVVALLSL